MKINALHPDGNNYELCIMNYELTTASQVPEIMAQKAVEYKTLDNVNWADQYPYKPKVEVAVARTEEAILLHYRVTEQSVRAVAQNDQDAVWEDSCVEFFSMPNPDDGLYYNVECNCAGKVLLACGKDRHNRERAPKEVTDSILRWTTLGTEPFEERKGEVSWELALILPKSIYFKHQINDINSLKIKANIYKCGDKLTVPHFISLFPIETEKPDFHCSEFFKGVFY